MKILRGRFALPTLAILLLFLLSACAPGAAAGSSKTPLDVLRDSTAAMKQLKTVHVALKVSSSFKTTGAPSKTTALFPDNFAAEATGDEVLPDQVSLTAKVTAPSSGSQNLSFAEIVKDKKAYSKSLDGKWYVTDIKGPSGSTSFTNIFSGTQNGDYNKFLTTVIQKATLTDHAAEALNGVNLRHITMSLSQDALKSLLTSLGSTTGLNSQQQTSLNAALDMFKLNKLALDVWVDEATSYLHRMEIKLDVDVHLPASLSPSSSATSVTPTPSSTHLALDMTIDYSKFNQPVTITAPADAISAQNVATIQNP